jgi:hypothetical protein
LCQCEGPSVTATQLICGFNAPCARLPQVLPQRSSAQSAALRASAMVNLISQSAIRAAAGWLSRCESNFTREIRSTQVPCCVGFLISACHPVHSDLVASSTARVSHQKTPRRHLQTARRAITQLALHESESASVPPYSSIRKQPDCFSSRLFILHISPLATAFLNSLQLTLRLLQLCDSPFQRPRVTHQ